VAVDLDDVYGALLRELEAHRERVQRVARGGGADSARGNAATEPVEAMARANVKPRLRMLSLYYYANLLGYLVLGTGNKAELTMGYFTKFGDGGADALPLGDLVKAEVRELARLLGVPREVVERAPSAGLWAGQTDEVELGLSYEQLDRFLLTGSSGDPAADAEIRRREAASRHKVQPALVARPR
jgi:NAD+ synthase